MCACVGRLFRLTPQVMALSVDRQQIQLRMLEEEFRQRRTQHETLQGLVEQAEKQLDDTRGVGPGGGVPYRHVEMLLPLTLSTILPSRFRGQCFLVGGPGGGPDRSTTPAYSFGFRGTGFLVMVFFQLQIFFPCWCRCGYQAVPYSPRRRPLNDCVRLRQPHAGPPGAPLVEWGSDPAVPPGEIQSLPLRGNARKWVRLTFMKGVGLESQG